MTGLTRDDVQRLSDAQLKTVRLAQQELADLWASRIASLAPEAQRDALLEAVPALVDRYAPVSASAASEWFETVRARIVGGDFTAVIPGDLTDPAERIAGVLRAQASWLFDTDDPEKMLRFADKVLDRQVHGAGRSTIASNMARDPLQPKWARVPTGSRPCAFCLTLASRGFVYSSASAAGQSSGFHDDDHCEVVPEWRRHRNRISGYDPDRFLSMYDAATSRIAAGDFPDEWRKAAEMSGVDLNSSSQSTLAFVLRRMYPDEVK